MSILDRIFSSNDEGIQWDTIRRTLSLHDEQEWENVFTFKRVDDQLIITATDGVNSHEVSLDAKQFAEHLGNGRNLTGKTVTAIPVTSHFDEDYFFLTIGSITGQWHVDKPRCIRLWKLCVEPFNI